MDLSALSKHLDSRNSSIESSFSGASANVTFFEGATNNMVLRLLVDPEQKTYRVVSCATASTKTLPDVAAAYAEATRFIQCAELSPAV